MTASFDGAIDVLVVGDANPDLVLTGDVVPAFGQAEQLLDSADLVLGGSAAITASGLARLGVTTGLVAVIGDDAFGDTVLARLTDNRVQTRFVARHPTQPTGLSVILAAQHDRSILTLTGTITLLDPEHAMEAVRASSARHVHFASYYLMPAFGASMPQLVAAIRALGATVSLDTNWDPSGAWSGLEALLPSIDIFLPNVAELTAIAASLGAAVAPPPQLASHLARLGPRVVVKDGAEGGFSADSAGAIVRAPGLLLDVVDTTGAGDSFNAGYLAAAASGIDDEAQRLRWATVAGSLSTRAAGGTGAQASRAELLAAL